MRLKEPHKILHDNRTCEMLSKLADTAVRVSHLDIVTITKSKMTYAKASKEFLKQIRLLQTVNMYVMQIINIL